MTSPLPQVCSWCGAHIGGPEPQVGGPISHGICKACSARLLAGYRQHVEDSGWNALADRVLDLAAKADR